MNDLYKPHKIEPDELPKLGQPQEPNLNPEPLRDNDMSKKTKLRLDFWKKEFWQEPHILGSVFHGAADVLVPGKYQRLIGLVEDAVDGDPDHRQGGKGYWTARKVVQIGVLAIILILITLAITGNISWGELTRIIEQLLPLVAGFLFIPFMLAASQGEKYRVLSPKQVWENTHPGEEYREPRIYPESAPREYYGFRTTDENGTEKICRDYFGDILTASGHVDYPFGANEDYRNLKYIDEHPERFELIPEETQPTNE